MHRNVMAEKVTSYMQIQCDRWKHIGKKKWINRDVAGSRQQKGAECDWGRSTHPPEVDDAITPAAGVSRAAWHQLQGRVGSSMVIFWEVHETLIIQGPLHCEYTNILIYGVYTPSSLRQSKGDFVQLKHLIRPKLLAKSRLYSGLTNFSSWY